MCYIILNENGITLYSLHHNQHSVFDHSIFSEIDTSGDDDHESDATDESNTESDHADASRESSSTDEDFIHRSSRNRDKMRRRRRRRLLSNQTARNKKRLQTDKMKVNKYSGNSCIDIIIHHQH